MRHKKWEDLYSKKAKKEQYPARSVYKLKEIQHKHNLIKKGYKVLDLGCYPGSWLLYAAKLAGNNGKVIGVDLKTISIKLPDHVFVYACDVNCLNKENILGKKKDFNVVLSDMAPSTTGNKHTDNARSYYLCCKALSVAKSYLVPGGSFVCKIFQGEDFNDFLKLVKKHFLKHIIFKPKSSKKASREIFVIGLDFQEEKNVRT